MLSESLIKSSQKLEELEFEGKCFTYLDFNKVINYAINLLLNKDNQMKLNGKFAHYPRVHSNR